MKRPLVYPTRSDYEVAVTHFEKFVRAPQFAGGRPLRVKKVTSNGSAPLITYSGGYTMVYPVEVGLRKRALRCWIKNPGNVKERYDTIAKYLREHLASYFVDFGYVEDGIVANGATYPICYMDWIDGKTLTEFIEDNISNKAILNQLSQGFLRMVEALHEKSVAHCDLQDGNVLIRQATSALELKVVDYDCVYVPTLSDDALPAALQGVPDYQHPKRHQRSREKADYFSELVIYLSLRAYEQDQKLWNKGQEKRLLFVEADFLNPTGSAIFSRLDQMSEEVQGLSRRLKQYCLQSDTNQFIPLERVVSANSKLTFDSFFGCAPKLRPPQVFPDPGPPLAVPDNDWNPRVLDKAKPVLVWTREHRDLLEFLKINGAAEAEDSHEVLIFEDLAKAGFAVHDGYSYVYVGPMNLGDWVYRWLGNIKAWWIGD